MAAALRINNVGPLGPGDNVLVGWAGIDQPKANDWIGFYEQGRTIDPLGAPGAGAIVWKPTDGSGAGNLFLPLPASILPGSYEVRLYCCGSTSLLAQIPAQVVSPIVAPPAPPSSAPAPPALPVIGGLDTAALARNPLVVLAAAFVVARMLGIGRR